MNDDEIDLAVKFLRDNTDLGDALNAIHVTLGRSINRHVLRRAFLKRGMLNPTDYLGAQLCGATGPAGVKTCGPSSFSGAGGVFYSPRVTKTIIVSDLHAPFHDRVAWNTCLAAINTIKPEIVVVIGDAADCHAISHYDKSPERRACLKTEVDGVNAELDKIKADRVIYCMGNHEARLETYLRTRAPELYGLISIRELFRIDDRGWEYVPYRSHIQVGKMHYTHDVGKAGKTATQATLDSFQHSIVVGHSHRAGVAYGGSVAGDRFVAMSVGWLGSFDEIEYANQSTMKDWVHSFGYVVQDEAGVAWVTVVPILGGKCIVDGRVITAEAA